MKTIIKVTTSDGIHEYVCEISPKLKTTQELSQAKKFSFAETISADYLLSALNIPHSMITKSNWED